MVQARGIVIQDEPCLSELIIIYHLSSSWNGSKPKLRNMQSNEPVGNMTGFVLMGYNDSHHWRFCGVNSKLNGTLWNAIITTLLCSRQHLCKQKTCHVNEFLLRLEMIREMDDGNVRRVCMYQRYVLPRLPPCVPASEEHSHWLCLPLGGNKGNGWAIQ